MHPRGIIIREGVFYNNCVNIKVNKIFFLFDIKIVGRQGGKRKYCASRQDFSGSDETKCNRCRIVTILAYTSKKIVIFFDKMAAK